MKETRRLPHGGPTAGQPHNLHQRRGLGVGARLGQAFRSPEFQKRAARYPEAAFAAPHVFKKLAVPGICVAQRFTKAFAAGFGDARTAEIHPGEIIAQVRRSRPPAGDP